MSVYNTWWSTNEKEINFGLKKEMEKCHNLLEGLDEFIEERLYYISNYRDLD